MTASQQKTLDLFEAREKIVSNDGLSIAQQRQMLDSLYTFVERGGQARDFDKRWRVIQAQMLAGQARGYTVTIYLN